MKTVFVFFVGLLFSGAVQSEADSDFLCTNQRLVEKESDIKPSHSIEAYRSCHKDDLILVISGHIGHLCNMLKPIIQLESSIEHKNDAYCYYRGGLRKVRNNLEDQLKKDEIARKQHEFKKSQKKLVKDLSAENN
ncbi:hypothetical protein Q4557_19295 [Shewanella sp. 5_MG-2023]|uniref:hypothetical protein n=1 Tax=Shewanella sp. 5_MG-2023 TaxID=3062656 RepID=UPI0026E38D16|nr:hypothetical protein [Shewanella sp. 5_MG-2023]MDO6642101.1 hypothetical protein [Shewanella sp. 5_MG-2023]